jgi:hypothetical protein
MQSDSGIGGAVLSRLLVSGFPIIKLSWRALVLQPQKLAQPRHSYTGSFPSIACHKVVRDNHSIANSKQLWRLIEF